MINKATIRIQCTLKETLKKCFFFYIRVLLTFDKDSSSSDFKQSPLFKLFVVMLNIIFHWSKTSWRKHFIVSFYNLIFLFKNNI